MAVRKSSATCAGCFTPLREAKVQRLLPRWGTERVGELADRALAFHT